MRAVAAFVAAHAAIFYILGGIALVVGVAVAFYLAALAGSIIAGVGCLTMAATAGRAGA